MGFPRTGKGIWGDHGRVPLAATSSSFWEKILQHFLPGQYKVGGGGKGYWEAAQQQAQVRILWLVRPLGLVLPCIPPHFEPFGGDIWI